MTDSRQFGGGKMRSFGDTTRQFPDRPSGGLPGDSQQCAECEAMLTDALDCTLSAEDQTRFERHAASCEPCAQLVADARRGAAWLELLRNPAPEPRADLLERILAQTNWSQIPASTAPAAMHAAGFASAPFAHGMVSGGVIPFPRQTFTAVRRSGFGRMVLQPRLAMTAAMAFFSIALTLNITGVHPTSLRLADLQPSNLRRVFFSADARVVQYYEGLRVVYELESRVHDLQSAPDTDTGSPSGSEATPSGGEPAPTQHEIQPAAPIPNAAPAGRQSGTRQHDQTKASGNPHTSRREDLIHARSMVVAETHKSASPAGSRHTGMERRLV